MKIKVGYEYIYINRYNILNGRYEITSEFENDYGIKLRNSTMEFLWEKDNVQSIELIIWLTTLDYYLCDGCIK